MKIVSPHENDLKIWSHFIRAQSNLISKLCVPIHLLPTKEKINSKGLIKVEINQVFDKIGVFSLIKRFFPKIKDEDIQLDKGYFLLDNNVVPRLENLEKFQEEVEKYYITFNTYPTIEGVLTDINSPLSKFIQRTNQEQIEIEFNSEEIWMPQKAIEIFDEYKPVLSRKGDVGVVYTAYIPYSKLIIRKTCTLLENILGHTDFFVNYKDFTISCTSITFNSDLFWYLNNLIGLKPIHHKIRVFVDSKQLKTENCHILKDIQLLEGSSEYYYEYNSADNQQPSLTPQEYLILTTHTIKKFYGSGGIFKTEYEPVDGYYSFDSRYSIYDEINKLELDDYTWSKIKEKLDPNIYQCGTLKNTISFDFTSQDDFITKYEQIRSIEWLDITDYRNEHKFKITPIIPNRFEDIKIQLSTKFNKIQFKDVNGGEKLIIRYGYKLTEDESDARLRFLNELDKYKNQGFGFSLDEQFKVKFIFEVDEELKEFEQNTKFNKIRGAEIKVNKDIIGTLRKAKFPILELQINTEFVAEFNQKLTEDNSFLSKIEPVLVGELEKIKRLENSVNQLNSDGIGLPNPNIVNFIFDSSKAKANEKVYIYEETSEEWQELERTKLSSNINKSQLKAVLTTLYAQDLAIVQGPPGTGKSTAISEILWQHIRKNPKQKILLTSETHLAVDNALDKLATPLTNLVKPIRFGKEDNLEEEGARFSLTRIQNWVESNQLDPSANNNGVSTWIKNISEKSGKNDSPNNIEEFIGIWKKVLNQPNTKIKTIFKNAYLDNANVIGATCSSIAERTSKDKWATFFLNYNNVFNRDKYDNFQELSKSSNKNDLFWSCIESINATKINFDVVIMDEASKATPAEFALPLLFGKKSIVVGDHRQLPPMLDENDFVTTLEMIGERQLANEFHKQDHNISHFEKLFLNRNISETNRASFDTQYRMHPQINEVIKQFYVDDSGLVCGLDPLQVDDPNLNNPVSRYHGFNLDGFIEPQTHVIWVDVDTPEVLEGTSRVNFGEIEACRTVLNCLINSDGFDEFQKHWQNNPKAKPEETEIGLISFYGRQLFHLEQIKREFANRINIRSNTVDRFQGMERNIIIVSMVRSNKLAGSKNQEPDCDTYGELGYTKQDALGFAEFPNRLNVALSRAKRLLIIVGNSAHFCRHEVYKNVYDTINQSPFDKIIDYKTFKNNTLTQTI